MIKRIRKTGIAARDSLTKEERIQLSQRIVDAILQSDVYKNSRTVMLYKAVRGEVRLSSLEKDASSDEKRFVYPLCIGEGIMIALEPEDESAWVKGSYGISEPIREKSIEVMPEDIDLVICPCTAFDEDCNRVGMGGGFYDRYLRKCVNAHIVSVAFEVQKAEKIPVQPWDLPMEMTFTEEKIYAPQASLEQKKIKKRR